MRVKQLKIYNFRGIKQAELSFDGHTLLIGSNNVGKSTICEALDLVLGPDRITRYPPIEEYDFYNAEYIDRETGEPKPFRIEVLLLDLSEEVRNRCFGYSELWHIRENRLLSEGEADRASPSEVVQCLRLEAIGKYNPEEDEFEAATYFSHGPGGDEDLQIVSKTIKRTFGFLYLRTLRTGSRALSLERGSLLDIILKVQGVRVDLWERSIKRLEELEPPIDEGSTDLFPILDAIEKRLGQYVSINVDGRATKLFVSQLTREHLRKTISFFLSMSQDQRAVPFQHVGTGTLNVLVLALLSFIAEAKRDNVIFAMEEPEIALPPHTQRRIASYLLSDTTQCFVSSHSPYIIERFEPAQITILQRDSEGIISSRDVASATALSSRMYKRHARRGLAEAMLGTGVIAGEGLTEKNVLSTVSAMMEADERNYPLDLSGVTIFSVDGDGSLPHFGLFFKELGIRTYAFYDKKERTAGEARSFTEAFDVPNETVYNGIEDLLVKETPSDRQWQFLSELRERRGQSNLGIPNTQPDNEALMALTKSVLKSNKGGSYASHLLELCEVSELPISITSFLDQVYNDFPKPESVHLPNADAGSEDATMTEDIAELTTSQSSPISRKEQFE